MFRTPPLWYSGQVDGGWSVHLNNRKENNNIYVHVATKDGYFNRNGHLNQAPNEWPKLLLFLLRVSPRTRDNDYQLRGFHQIVHEEVLLHGSITAW